MKKSASLFGFKNQYTRLFFLLLSVVTVLVAYNTFVLVLNASNFGFNFGFTDKSGNFTVRGFSVYTVQVGDTIATYENASIASQSLKARGGGGYIYSDEGYGFRILASGYSDRTDAIQVASGLAGEGVKASVFTIAIPNIKIMGESKNQAAIAEHLEYLKSTYAFLYHISILLDMGELNAENARLSILEFLRDGSEIFAKLDGVSKILYKLLEDNFTLMQDQLTKLINFRGDTSSYSSLTKHSYLNIAHSLSVLAETID